MLQIGSTKLHYGTYFSRFLHIGVVLMYSILLLNIILIPKRFPNIFSSHRVVRHGWEYRNYLFSIWGTIAQFVYFCMYIAIDILEIQGGNLAMKIKQKMQSIASYMLFTFIFPLSVHIFILFWCFYAWDREYIYPKVLDDMAPFWLNHILHTYPPVLAVIYMLAFNENEPPIKSTFSGLATLMAAYSVLFLYIKAVHGVWIYQAFDMFHGALAKCILLYCAIGALPFLFLGHKLNKILIGSTKLHYGTYFSRFLHIGVVLMYSILLLNIILIPKRFPNIFSSHRVVRHGWEYRNYLFSIWGTIAQFVYFCMYIAIDILEIQGGNLALKIKQKMQSIASYMLFTFIFPLSVHIFILFWCFYAWDREYIYPKVLDDMAPFWLNHILHTYPPVLAVIYMLAFNENEPPIKSTFSGLATLMAAYSVLFLYIKAVHGVWIYQAFDMFHGALAKCILLYCAIGALPFLFLGHKLNKILIGLKQKFSFTMATKESILLHEKAM